MKGTSEDGAEGLGESGGGVWRGRPGMISDINTVSSQGDETGFMLGRNNGDDGTGDTGWRALPQFPNRSARPHCPPPLKGERMLPAHTVGHTHCGASTSGGWSVLSSSQALTRSSSQMKAPCLRWALRCGGL